MDQQVQVGQCIIIFDSKYQQDFLYKIDNLIII